MKRHPIFTSAFLTVLLFGCGGDPDLPRSSGNAQQAIVRADQRPPVELDQPLTNAQAYNSTLTNPGAQHKQSALTVGGSNLNIDTSDREAVRLFFNRLYGQATPPINWSGDYMSGNAGATNPAFQEATIQRINWYRAMAGLPASTTLSAANSAKAQQAAFMMSANGQLSHFPETTWKFYTSIGAEAARSSNLALGNTGPSAIDAYISDYGDNNYLVGHRRWVFHPNARSFGTGDVPRATVDGKDMPGANALWVLDADMSAVRPKVRDDFVAWPTKGYVPYGVVYNRWSISYPNADFSQAKVSLSRDGAPADIALEKVETGYAENTLVWKVPAITGRSHDRPARDLRYHVVVSGVMVAQQARSFEYDVIVFDPAVETVGAVKPQASAPTLVRAGASYTVQIAPMPNVTAYDLLAYRRKALNALAQGDYNNSTWLLADGASADTLGAGTLALYEDGHGGPWLPQIATLAKKLAVDPSGGAISFLRSVGYAKPDQSFRVQVSTDEGASWSDVYAEVGRELVQTPASSVRVSLNAYGGRQIRIRMAEGYTTTSYIGTGTGWTIKNISFEGIDELVDQQEFRSVDGSFTLASAQAGRFALVPRVQYRSAYFSDPGPLAFVLVDGAILNGPRSAYTVERVNGVLTITDNVGRDGVQTVLSPFRLDFSDSTLAFDIDGNAGKAYRLYRAAFDRKPDSAGLGFWISGLDGGLSMEAMARGFAASAEFARLYGPTPSNLDVITTLYRSVLHRAPDPEGAAFWLNHMANGVPIEVILIEFSESQENKAQVAPEIAQGIGFIRH